jgi:hypothetical protein
VPHAVQQTARSEAKGREIADIDHEMWNGRPVYEIEYKERGLNSRIYVADDGIVVRDERPARSLKSLYMGTQIENTPAAVQDRGGIFIWHGREWAQSAEAAWQLRPHASPETARRMLVQCARRSGRTTTCL